MLIVIDLQLHPHIPHSTIHILAWVSLVISKEENVLPIYRVSGGVDTIFRGEKSEGRNFCKNHQKITDISAIYRFHTINRWNNGKMAKKKNENRRYFGLSTRYSVPSKFSFSCAVEGIRTRPPGQACPLLNMLHLKYIFKVIM